MAIKFNPDLCGCCHPPRVWQCPGDWVVAFTYSCQTSRRGHAGPPCETYSLARWLEIEDSIYPRPLRSCEQPWGLDGRTLRETRQWMMGNILMWRALFLLFTIYAYGGSFTLEHPKGCGGKDNKWTIWDSSFIKQLMLAGDIKLWAILQGPLGQPFAKPTNLLAARLERLGRPSMKATTSDGGRRQSLGAVKAPSGKRPVQRHIHQLCAAY